MKLFTVASLLLAVISIVQCGEANKKKNKRQGILSSNIGNSYEGKYKNVDTQENDEQFSTNYEGFGQRLQNNNQGNFNNGVRGAGRNNGGSFEANTRNKATISTVTQTVGVLVPQPYTVTVNRPVPVQVPQPFTVYVPRAVQVPVPVPRPVAVPRPVPYTVTRTVAVPVQVPVQVPVPQPVGVIVPQPYTVTVPRPYPVKVPQKFVIPVAQHIFVGNEAQGANEAQGVNEGQRATKIKSGTGVRGAAAVDGFRGASLGRGLRGGVENNIRGDYLIYDNIENYLRGQGYSLGSASSHKGSNSIEKGHSNIRNGGSSYRNGNSLEGIQSGQSIEEKNNEKFQNYNFLRAHSLSLGSDSSNKGTYSLEQEYGNVVNGGSSYRSGNSLGGISSGQNIGGKHNEKLENYNSLRTHSLSLGSDASNEGTHSLEEEHGNFVNGGTSYKSGNSLGGIRSGQNIAGKHDGRLENYNSLRAHSLSLENDSSDEGSHSLEEEHGNFANTGLYYRSGNSLGGISGGQNINGQHGEKFEDLFRGHRVSLESASSYKGTNSLNREHNNFLSGRLVYRNGNSLGGINGGQNIGGRLQENLKNANLLEEQGFSLERGLPYKGTGSLEGSRGNLLNSVLAYKSGNSLRESSGSQNVEGKHDGKFEDNSSLRGQSHSLENALFYKTANSLERGHGSLLSGRLSYKDESILRDGSDFSSSNTSNGNENQVSVNGGLSYKVGTSLGRENGQSLKNGIFYGTGHRSGSSYSSVSVGENDKY